MEYHVNKNDIINFIVSHKEHLAKKYLKKFVNCSDLLNDKEIQIIKNNQSVILIHDDNIVGAVITYKRCYYQKSIRLYWSYNKGYNTSI